MTQKNSTIKKLSFIIAIAILFLLQNLAFALSSLSLSKKDVFADNAGIISEISISNSDFTGASSTKPGEPNSFTAKGEKGSTIAGVIDTNTDSFANDNEDSYKLNFNPNTPLFSEDSKVLMINNQNLNSSYGYASSNFTLAKNGYYVVSAYVYTQYDEISSTASLYLSSTNLDSNENSRIENISTRGIWKEFRFYVKTASSDESVNLILYIGTKDNFKSQGAVFFDNLSAKSLNEAEYYNQLNNIKGEYKEISLTSKNVSNLNGITNGDFENTNSDFIKLPSSTGVSTAGSVAKVVGIGEYFNSEDSLIEKNPTSANRLNNNYALLINNAEANYVAFESNEILIEQHKNYKLSIDVKTSNFVNNGANITLTQINPFNSSDYTVATQSFTAINTSSETNSITNNWITYSFFIKGNVFKDSKAKLTLALGDSQTLVKGYTLFDNIILEEITSTDYTNNSSNANSKTIDFSNISESSSISNGAFNNVTIEDVDKTYPYKASNITITNSNEEDNFNGIINVNSSNFNKHSYPFVNPVSPNNSNADLSYNNVLVLANKVSGYQIAKTDNFTVSASSFYKINLSINTQNVINSNISVILSSSTETIGQVKNITTNSQWQEIEFYVKSFEEEKSCTLTINFGSENTNNKGYVFIDNAKLTTIEETDYNNATTNSFTKVCDLSKLDLSIISDNSNNYYYSTPNFTGTKNSTDGNCEAGILNVSTHPTLDVDYVVSPYVLTIHNITDAYYSMKSTSYKLTSGNYYKVSVSVKTLFAKQDENNKEFDEEENAIPFGAKIELTGINESFSGIVTENDYETYTFYINATSDTTISFNLSLGDAKALTSGYAFFDNLNIEKIEADDFNTANEEKTEEDNKTLIIGSTESDEEEPEDTTTPAATNFDWLVLPTLITAIALLIAMVGALLRKLNIKLPVRTNVKDYDRAKTIVKEYERREILKQREERLQALRIKLQEIQGELNATKEEYRSAKSLREEIKIEHKKIEAKIKEQFKDVTSKQAIEETRRLKLEAKAKIKQERKEAYLRRRNELINKYLEIEKEIEMILAEERLLVQEYKAYKKQLKLEKAEARAKKKSKK